MEDNLFTSHFLQHGTALVPFSAALAALGPPRPLVRTQGRRDLLGHHSPVLVPEAAPSSRALCCGHGTVPAAT